MNTSPLRQENFEPIPLVSSVKASARADVTNDYVALLCRQGKVRGAMIGRAWYVDENSLKEFLFQGKQVREVKRVKQSEQFKQEYYAKAKRKTTEAAPVIPVAVVPAKKTLTYVEEAPAIIFSSREPERTEPLFSKQLAFAFGALFLCAVSVAGASHASDAFTRAALRWDDHVLASSQSAALSLAGAQEFFCTKFFLWCPDDVELWTLENIPAGEISTPAATSTQNNSVVQTRPTTIIQNTYPVVERVVEREVVSGSGTSLAYINSVVANLRTEFNNSIGRSVGVSVENLSDNALTAADLTDANIPDDLTLSLSNALAISSGGTGTSTAPTYGKLLLGNSSGTYDLVATSSLGIVGSGGSSFDYPFPSNATSTTLTFSGGLLSTASSTFTGDVRLPSLSAGGVALDSTGLAYTFSTSTWAFASSTLLADNNTFTNALTAASFVGSSASATSTLAGGFSAASSLYALQNGKVGVGTAAPRAKLNVTNTGDDYSFLVEDSASPDTTPFVISSSGEVGIGTATLNHILNISYPSAPQILVQESTTEFLRVGVGETSGQTIIGWDDADSLQLGVYINPISTSITSLVSILSSGNVGIGTTSPLAKLSVAGNAYIGGNLTATGTLSILGATTLANATSSAFAITSLTSALLKTDSSGNLIAAVAGTDYIDGSSYFSYPFPNAATSTALTFTGGLTSYASTTIGNGTAMGGLTISGGATTTGTAYFASSVGVGTSSPFRKLAITDTVAAAQVAIAYDASRYAQLQVDSAGDFVISSQGQDTFWNDDNVWVCTGGSCPAGNPTGTGNFITENKLGIGTSTPSAKLTIETQDDSTDFLQIASTTAQSLFVVDADGKVGIGTSSPIARLSVGANGSIITTEKDLTDGASISVDWLEGNQQRVVLGGNRTVSFSNYYDGQVLRLVVCQDGTGSRTVSWGTQILWNDGTEPTLTTTADKCDLLSFVATQATSTLKIFGAAATNF